MLPSEPTYVLSQDALLFTVVDQPSSPYRLVATKRSIVSVVEMPNRRTRLRLIDGSNYLLSDKIEDVAARMGVMQ